MSELLWQAKGKPADLLIRGARVVDPAAQLDAELDVAIAKGRIVEVGKGLAAPGGRGARVIDAAGLVVLPGFVDLHAHLRAPGREDEEDIASGTAAAAAGGYTAVFAMANTDPVVDNAAVLQALVERALQDALVPCGFFAAVSRGLQGRVLTEMAELAAAGAVGFSDDGRPLATALLVRRALQYAKLTGRFVAIHAQDDTLMGKGVMHEGAVSARLGLGGIPSLSESVDVERACAIAAYEDGRLHVCHVSAAASVDAIARARAAGVKVTAEVTPHHLALTDDEVLSLETSLKMNPPLRPEEDRAAMVEALRDGLIDCIATDHAPHAQHEKEVPFEAAVFGTTGLETAFAVVNTACVATGDLTLGQLADRMSQAPARIAGISVPAVAVGEAANLCVVDPGEAWTVAPAAMKSKSRNTAWAGRKLTGRVKATVAGGRLVWEDVG